MVLCINPRELSDHLAMLGDYQLVHVWYQKKFYRSPLTNYVFGVAMGGLLSKLRNFKKVKLIFGHPVYTSRFLLTGYVGLI